MLSVLWILCTALISPVLVLLAIRTKKQTLRLPEADGEPFGNLQSSSLLPSLNLLFLGESPVAGVGVKAYNHSLAAQSANTFSKLTRRSVFWRALGKNGITIDRTIDELVPQIQEQTIDYLVIMLGVNDVTSLSSLNHWNLSIERLISKLRELTNAKILFYGCPPLAQFPALPKPLAIVAGARATLFDQVTQSHHLNDSEFVFTPFKTSIISDQFAEDGYHPSAIGCVEMGKRVANDLFQLKDSEKN